MPYIRSKTGETKLLITSTTMYYSLDYFFALRGFLRSTANSTITHPRLVIKHITLKRYWKYMDVYATLSSRLNIYSYTVYQVLRWYPQASFYY